MLSSGKTTRSTAWSCARRASAIVAAAFAAASPTLLVARAAGPRRFAALERRGLVRAAFAAVFATTQVNCHPNCCWRRELLVIQVRITL
jgi:hypothetical protein